jgi:hypothetical protein
MERGRRDGRAAPVFGGRVRVVVDGPHRGEQGEVTSVLGEGGTRYYQVRLPGGVGLFTAEQLDLLTG